MVINLEEKFAKFSNHWHPYIVAELNESHVKIAKVKDELIWHTHLDEDEMFIVVKGTLIMDFKDKTVTAKAGEILIVPKGVEHRPRTNGEEVRIILIEPKTIKHTGDIKIDQTVEKFEWI